MVIWSKEMSDSKKQENLNDLLLHTCKLGDLELFLSIKQMGGDINLIKENCFQWKGITCLQVALYYESKSIVNYLKENLESVHISDILFSLRNESLKFTLYLINNKGVIFFKNLSENNNIIKEIIDKLLGISTARTGER